MNNDLSGDIDPNGQPVPLGLRASVRISLEGGNTRSSSRFIEGSLVLPQDATDLVLFASGKGDPYNAGKEHIARVLNNAGFATLLLNLLTPDEEQGKEREDNGDRSFERLDVDLICSRLREGIRWLEWEPQTAYLGVGIFGIGTQGARTWGAYKKRWGVPTLVLAEQQQQGGLLLENSHSWGAIADLAVDWFRKHLKPVDLVDTVDLVQGFMTLSRHK